ncbi:MAG: hypothetical protein IJQ13_05340 [Prevotella sp.]|nr:hypothetical protein [Prevotella sp.]
MLLRDSQWFTSAKNSRQKRVGPTSTNASGWLQMLTKEFQSTSPTKNRSAAIPASDTTTVVTMAILRWRRSSMRCSSWMRRMVRYGKFDGSCLGSLGARARIRARSLVVCSMFHQ